MSRSLYSDCAGLPYSLMKCREHIRALRSDADVAESLGPCNSLQPGSLSFVFMTILTRIPHSGHGCLSCTLGSCLPLVISHTLTVH